MAVLALQNTCKGRKLDVARQSGSKESHRHYSWRMAGGKASWAVLEALSGLDGCSQRRSDGRLAGAEDEGGIAVGFH